MIACSRAAGGEPEAEIAKGAWSDIFRDGRGLYSVLVIGGIAMHASQMLVIAIIMPTIVANAAGLGDATDPFCWCHGSARQLS